MPSIAASIVEGKPFGKLTHYTFEAEEKHAKYGLRPDCLYRAKRDQSGRTFGRPVLVHDETYGPMQPVLANMVPFRRLLPWPKHDAAGNITGFVPDDDPTRQKAEDLTLAIDLSLAILLIAVLAVIIIVLA